MVQPSTSKMGTKLFITLLFFFTYGVFLYQTAMQSFSFTTADLYMLLGFFGMYLILSFFPIQLRQTTLTLDVALALSLFLIYGFYVEAWMTQFSLFLVMIFSGVRNYRRYLVNMIMFLLISYLSAFAYDGVNALLSAGGISAELSFYLAVLAYIFIYFVSNEILILIARWLIYDAWSRTPFTETAWNLLIILIISPLGLLLYLFFKRYGHESLLFFSVPILVLSLFTRFYYEIQGMNQRLQELNGLVNTFTSKLHLNEVMDAIFQAVYAFYPVDGLLFYWLEDGGLQVLGSSGALPEGPGRDEEGRMVWTEGEKLASETLKERRMMRFSEEEGDGILSLPLIRNGEAQGVLLLCFRKSVTFTPMDRYLWQVLANQAGNAIFNAMQYEKTYMRVYHDELTGLANFRAFDTTVHRLVEEADRQKAPLSLLLFDLDHFKEINDRYGHLAGDEVLRNISKKLSSFFRDLGQVYRYGGEEFTALLPGIGEEQAFRIAEEIRREIEVMPLEVTDSIQSEGERVSLRVTVSIGISTYPTQAKEPLQLVRNADRAMYMGAKQAGRNRVCLYAG